MLKITGRRLYKIICSRYTEYFKMHPNFESKIPYDYDRPLPEINDLADYANAVVLTIRKYFHYHASNSDVFELSFSADGSAKVEPLGGGGTWMKLKAECFQTALDILNSNDPMIVYTGIVWSIHLAHLAGTDGIRLDKYKLKERTGSLLLDHGDKFGITYELIDKLSNGSIESVWPEIMAYF